MESTSTPGLRRTEDIALDLLKFVAAAAHVGSKSPNATGFGAAASSKSEDQVTQLLELYARCRTAVEGSATAAPSQPATR